MTNFIEVDGESYDISNANQAVKEQLANIQFVNELILQKNNELNAADTAKMGYSRAFMMELKKTKDA